MPSPSLCALVSYGSPAHPTGRCLSAGPCPLPSLSCHTPGFLHAGPGGTAPPACPCCPWLGRPQCRSVGAAGCSRIRLSSGGLWGPLLVTHRENPCSATCPETWGPHHLLTSPGTGPRCLRRPPLRPARPAFPSPAYGPVLTAGCLSPRGPLGCGPEHQLPRDAQLPGELMPRRPCPGQSPLPLRPCGGHGAETSISSETCGDAASPSHPRVRRLMPLPVSSSSPPTPRTCGGRLTLPSLDARPSAPPTAPPQPHTPWPDPWGWH